MTRQQQSERAGDSHPSAVMVLRGPVINALWDTAEVAQHLGCSAQHVRRLCRRGHLPARRVGPDWRIDPQDLEGYVLPPPGRPRVAQPRHNAQRRHERYLRSRAAGCAG